MADGPPNGWESWGKHVLLELQRLNTEIRDVHTTIDSCRDNMATMAQEVRLNTTFRMGFCESWLRYRVVIVGAFITAVIGVIIQLVKAGVGI